MKKSWLVSWRGKKAWLPHLPCRPSAGCGAPGPRPWPSPPPPSWYPCYSGPPQAASPLSSPRHVAHLWGESTKWREMFVKRRETPLPAQTRRLPQVSVIPSTVCGEENLLLPPPLTHLWSSARAAHLLVSVQMNSCIPELLLPGNWKTDKENNCYPNSSLSGYLW